MLRRDGIALGGDILVFCFHFLFSIGNDDRSVCFIDSEMNRMFLNLFMWWYYPSEAIWAPLSMIREFVRIRI